MLVIGLPAVQAPELPVLHAVDPKSTLCAQTKPLVLPVVGAPYVFATGYAHDFVLRVQTKRARASTFPRPLMRCGVALSWMHRHSRRRNCPRRTGTLHGYWGFDPFEGPSFHLANAHPEQWTLASADQHALIVGRKDTVHLDAAEVSCVDGVTIKDAEGKTLDATWKAVKPNEIQVDMPLDWEQAGVVNLEVKQVGLDKAGPSSLAHLFRSWASG